MIMGIRSLLKKLAAPLTLVNKLVPKDKKLILIYSNLGFRDNAKALYDHLTEQGYNSKYKIVCSCCDHREWKAQAPENVKFIGTRGALRRFFRCSYMFYSFGKFPVKPTKKQTVVNLWHGMPLKSVAALEKGVKFDGKCYFDYTIATSPFFSEVMQRCFGVSEDKVLLTGQPRDDKLFVKDTRRKKLILWLPTYRSSRRLGSENARLENETGLPLIETEEQLRELDDMLGECGYKLLIKHHPMQDNVNGIKGLKNVMHTSQRALEHQGMDIYDLMKRSTALITDYSSVYFDYLLLDRPIGFTLDDIDRYADERGFTVDDPEVLMAGRKLRSFDDLVSFVVSAAEGKDGFASERQSVNELVNSCQAGNASERILDIIGVSL